MSKVKVINLKALVEGNTEQKYTTQGNDSVAIIEGPRGVIVCDIDAVHMLEPSINETFLIPLKYNNGKMVLMPVAQANLSVKELLESEHVIEQPLEQYIQWFGSRIESNYRELLGSIKDAGLDENLFRKQ